MSDFLPKDYKIPASKGSYMKLKDGNNAFRILSTPILGHEWWEATSEGQRPFRVRMGETPESTESKHFWAMVVYNRKEESVQILQITQKTIQEQILEYVNNPKWGDPKQYDLVIVRKGEDLDTKYSVLAEPKEALDGEVLGEYKRMNINLDALFEGEDPFNSGGVDPTVPDQIVELVKKDDLPF